MIPQDEDKGTRPTFMQEVARPLVGRHKGSSQLVEPDSPGAHDKHATANGYREWNRDTSSVSGEPEADRRAQGRAGASKQEGQRWPRQNH